MQFFTSYQFVFNYLLEYYKARVTREPFISSYTPYIIIYIL